VTASGANDDEADVHSGDGVGTRLACQRSRRTHTGGSVTFLEGH